MTVSFTELMAGLSPNESGELAVTIPDSWMQGRTTYGGLSAAICLQAVQNSYPELPPLRSAQINFVGPAGGPVWVTSKVLRQGRSVAYISAELASEQGIATHAVFCFGAKRESKMNRDFTFAPSVPSPEDSKNFFTPTNTGPVFTQNFDCRLAAGGHPVSGSEEHEHFIWARNKDNAATGTIALLGLADMPPPAVLPMFKEFAPISSMTWMLNFLNEKPTTRDGWWLMRSAAEHAKDGYSSQDMQVWNTDMELVITGRQNVAIFY